MAHLSHLEITNWIALYVATGLCCAIAMALSVTTAGYQLIQERAWSEIRSARDAALFVPKTWWRWQKLYLTSTPVTLAIIIAFGTTLRWA
jgi:hypothetical protein